MYNKTSVLGRLMYLAKNGRPKPEPIEMPPWPSEWTPFGEDGAMMRTIINHGANTSLYLFQAPAGLVFGRHSHWNTEVLTILAGSGTLKIFDYPEPDSEVSVELQTSDSHKISPLVEHDFRSGPDGCVILLSYIPSFAKDAWAANLDLSTIK